MRPVGRDQNVVAWTKVSLFFALNTKPRGASKNQNPFVVLLPVGPIQWRKLTR